MRERSATETAIVAVPQAYVQHGKQVAGKTTQYCVSIGLILVEFFQQLNECKQLLLFVYLCYFPTFPLFSSAQNDMFLEVVCRSHGMAWHLAFIEVALREVVVARYTAIHTNIKLFQYCETNFLRVKSNRNSE